MVSDGIKDINQLLKYGDHPGISRWAQCNHKHSLNVEEGGRRSVRERFKEALLHTLRIEEEVRKEEVSQRRQASSRSC